MNKSANLWRGHGRLWTQTAVVMVVSISVAFFVTRASSQAPSSSTAPSVEPAIANPKTDETAPKGGTAKVESVRSVISPNLIVVGTYPFTATSGVSLEDMTSGTTQLVAADQDDTPSPVVNIGFDFWFDGVRFTQFSCNANGLCHFGPIAISIAFDNTTGFETTTDAPKVAPYFDDLLIGTNGKVHFKTIGSAPNRKLIVEWLNEQIPKTNISGPGAGTFQMWLFETTGVIEFVYGPGIVLNNANSDSNYTIGLQSGAAANLASVTSSTATVSYVSANNLQTDPIAAGTAYLFTPNVPAAPTGLNFTGTSAVATTLNWTDNSSNEVGFVISRSTDGGTTYNFLTQTAANATSFTDNTVLPTTTYFYQVRAVTEGALSGPITNTVTTNPVGNVSTTAAGGNWSLNSTWAGGVAPTASDNVTIVNGATVTIDTPAQAYSLTVGTGGSPSVLQFESATTRLLTVGTDVSIATNGTLRSSTTGTVTAHSLSLAGNLTNNGTLDFSTNGNTAGAGITFTGAANSSFSGSGAITDVRSITVNKGSSLTSTLELNPTNFTVQGVATDVAGYLTLTNGTFKISGNFPLVNRTFTTPAYTIPATAGIWLNNPNYTVAGTATGSTTSNNGLLRVSQGTYNIGVGASDQMRGGLGASFTIEGGTVNISGAFGPQTSVVYTQTGGTVNVGTIGNNAASFGTFQLSSSGSSFNMSGGTINVINPSTGSTKIDYRVNSVDANTNISGGTVVIGAGAAPANSIYNVFGQMPNTTVNAAQTMRLNSSLVSMRGTTVTNNGIIDYTGTNSRYDFASSIGPMTYGGSGLFGTAIVPVGTISSNSSFPITLNSAIFCNKVNLFKGGFINSNLITLGSGGTSSTTVQIGSPGLTTPGGNFDVSPIHNQGTGGETVVYAFETAPRSTGVEINPTRVLTSLTIGNPNSVTIVGGDLTLTSSGIPAALALNDGRLITGVNNLILSSGTASVTRMNGYVDGNLRKNFSASASKVFEVGTANGYSPVTVNVTGGTPSDITVKAIQGPQPNIFSTALALQRYWKLTAPAGVTADLTFQYLLSDVSGNESIYQVLKYNGAFSTPPGSSVDMVNHRGLAPAQLAFTADWTVGQPNAPTAAPATIGGQITTTEGAALGGVTISLNGYQNRRTITDANGNYHFDNVETDHFYTVTPELTNYSFSPTNRAFSLLGSRSDATFTSTTTHNGNPVTGGDFFVRQQYLDFLGREPDNGGWLYWTSQISVCGGNEQCLRARRIDVSAAFFDSEEFQQTGAFIYGLYKSGLGRQLSYLEFLADRPQLVAGADLEINKQAFTDTFVQRAEFLQKYQGAYTAESFVDALLANVWQATGIDLTANREALIVRYASGGEINRSRSLVLRDVVSNSAVRDAQYNPSFVLMEYFGYLRRDPDTGGYAYWLDVLNNRETGNYRGMVCAFITSEEYQRRFSTVVSYSNRDCGP